MSKIINSIKTYFEGVWKELAKVSWPTKKEVFDHTVIVLVSIVVALGIVTVVDFGLSKAVEYIISIN